MLPNVEKIRIQLCPVRIPHEGAQVFTTGKSLLCFGKVLVRLRPMAIITKNKKLSNFEEAEQAIKCHDFWATITGEMKICGNPPGFLLDVLEMDIEVP